MTLSRREMMKLGAGAAGAWIAQAVPRRCIAAPRKGKIPIGLGLWSLMTALSGFAKNGAQLTIARVGVGVGEATASPSAYSLISDYFPARLRATALSIYSSGIYIGSGLSLLIGGLIVENWNRHFPDGGPMGLASSE